MFKILVPVTARLLMNANRLQNKKPKNIRGKPGISNSYLVQKLVLVTCAQDCAYVFHT